MLRKIVAPFVWAYFWIRFGRIKPQPTYTPIDNSDLNAMLRKATDLGKRN